MKTIFKVEHNTIKECKILSKVSTNSIDRKYDNYTTERLIIDIWDYESTSNTPVIIPSNFLHSENQYQCYLLDTNYFINRELAEWFIAYNKKEYYKHIINEYEKIPNILKNNK